MPSKTKSSGPEAESSGTAALIHADEKVDPFPPPNVILPKGTTIIMEPLTVLFCIAFNGLGPLISQYVYDRIGRDMGLSPANSSHVSTARCNVSDRYANDNSSSQYALTQLVQDRTSSWILYRDVISAAAAAISIPLINSSSDRVGRRIAVILPCAGTLAESVVTLAVIYFDLPLACILVAAAASGFCGGIGCLFAGALAYLADITPIGARPRRITVLEALTGVGGAGAAVLIGWWIRWQGYVAPHLFCTAVYVAAAAFSLFLVPEVRRRSVSPDGALTAVRQVLSEPARGMASLMTRPHSLPIVYGLVLSGTFLYCATYYGTLDLTVLYSMNYPFCLDSVLIGYVSAGKQMVQQIGMLAVVWLLHPGLSTLTIASLGLASTAASAVLLAVAWDQAILWVSIGAALVAGCPVPMYRAFVSMVTPADKQGCVFSAFGVLQMLAYLAGNVAFTSGYKATLMWQPGFVFYTVAAALVVGLLLTVAAELVYRLRTVPATAAAGVSSIVVDIVDHQNGSVQLDQSQLA